MKGFHRICIGLTAVLLLGAQDAPTGPDADDIAAYSNGSRHYWSYAPQYAGKWDTDLRQALEKGSFDQAVAALAKKYGLEPDIMRDLAQLWVRIDGHRYSLHRSLRTDDTGPSDLTVGAESYDSMEDLFGDEDESSFDTAEAYEAMEEPRGDEPLAPALRDLRAQLLALLGRSDRAPLVIEVVAAALDIISECSLDTIDAMLADASDPAADAWRIADAMACSPAYLHVAALAPERNMPALIRLASYGDFDAPDTVPLFALLTRDTQLARIAEPDRLNLSAWLFRKRAALLFDLGLSDEAVALIDGVSPALRAQILAETLPEFTARVDGLPILIRGTDSAVRLEYAAAKYLAGDRPLASELVQSAASLAAARSAFECLYGPEGSESGGCEMTQLPPMEILVLDQLLHRPDADPYPIAETLIARDLHSNLSEPLYRLRCRLFTEAEFPKICANARRSFVYGLRLEPYAYKAEEVAALRAKLDALLPGFAQQRAAMIDVIRRVLAAEGGNTDEADYTRARIEPEYPDYSEQPLPERYRGAAPAQPNWPDDFSRLPKGFYPVRFERSGNRAVAVSISQNFDPTGEVTGGGYWIHLSEDGGRHWQDPLYTGLAEGFPYVVAPTSKMPLLAGDTIHLAVDIALIDTRSITYPPVGLELLRKEEDRYLTLSLATLRADSDGDGLSDIAARHLLLDRAVNDGGTPFVVGSTPPAQCTEPPSAEKRALMALLKQLFSVNSGAIVAPRPGASDPASSPLVDWRAAAQGTDRPILVEGDPADFACLKTDRLMVVYSDADIAQLQRFTPDFRTISIPTIVYNRAHDRGYVIWSAGWTGGTFRLRLVDGEWQFETISEWIT